MATLASPGSTLPRRCTMETYPTSQLPVGHRTVRLILQVLHHRTLRLVDSRRTDERGNGAAAWPLSVTDQSSYVQRIVDYGEHSAAGDGRQHGYLVARGDAVVRAGVLAVDGEGQCVAHRGEIGMPLGEQRPDLRERCAVFQG